MVFSTKDQKLKKVRAVLSSNLTSNYRLNLRLWRAISQECRVGFLSVFFYLFVFSSSVTYVKTEKMTFTSSGLKGFRGFSKL